MTLPVPIARVRALCSPPDGVDRVQDLLADVWENASHVGPTERLCFETALVELAGNVLAHAHADAGEGLRWEVRIEVDGERIEATVTDDGVADRVELDDRPMPEPLAEHGRGLPLIRSLVDGIHYQRLADGNEWRITRKAHP
jgi:anti-sigma regulatory factor (Ser/Thr protein kinase)